MSQHVRLENGKVIPIQTLRSLTQAEIDSPLEKTKRDTFDKAIHNLYGDHNAPTPNWIEQRKKPDVLLKNVRDNSFIAEKMNLLLIVLGEELTDLMQF